MRQKPRHHHDWYYNIYKSTTPSYKSPVQLQRYNKSHDEKFHVYTDKLSVLIRAVQYKLFPSVRKKQYIPTHTMMYPCPMYIYIYIYIEHTRENNLYKRTSLLYYCCCCYLYALYRYKWIYLIGNNIYLRGKLH